MWYADDPRIEQVAGIAARHQLAVDTLLFVVDLLHTAPQYSGDEPGDAYDMPRHTSAMEVCRAVPLYARALFQSEWKVALRDMGLIDSSDLGKVVYLLVEERQLEAEAGDRPEDFDGVCRFVDA
ncbi:hypothetical protein NG895_06770 [Aeoliella sp. ICT_H6.2]|uniref:Uncharacterized protein n=1 Tax=Aeoliella straminimaris TaxID=2954799 RepID=A0A9X2F7E7_9BACT|nr:hypothetical protein [Aeoliella straminimaris]MCO6043605.1 hypothetical protein [Aeoliella straminimaris]